MAIRKFKVGDLVRVSAPNRAAFGEAHRIVVDDDDAEDHSPYELENASWYDAHELTLVSPQIDETFERFKTFITARYATSDCIPSNIEALAADVFGVAIVPSGMFSFPAIIKEPKA